MRVLVLSDRLSVRGGADLYLRQVMEWVLEQGAELHLAVGRVEAGVEAPQGAELLRVKGLGLSVASTAGLSQLAELLRWAELVLVQNVMNPVPLRQAGATGKAVAVVQDHRVFCPGSGKTLADGRPCRQQAEDRVCAECLPERGYRRRLLRLTRERRDALAGAKLVVLSEYMAAELAAAGRPDARVIPPWVEPGADAPTSGNSFVLGGRLVPHKAPTTAYRAWRAAQTGLPLVVAGVGPSAGEMYGAQHLGWLPQPELRRLLHGARALLFPGAWQEPFGMLAVEALAEGTPVVVAAGGGTGDWSGRGCLRVAPGDVQAMAAALRHLAGDPELARVLGRQGREFVAHRFARRRSEASWRTLAAELVAQRSIASSSDASSD